MAGLLDASHLRQAAVRDSGVSDSCSVKLLQGYDRFGSYVLDPRGRPQSKGQLYPYKALLAAAVETEPGITMPEISGRLIKTDGVATAPVAL